MEPLSFTIDCRELVSCAAAHDCFARILPCPQATGGISTRSTTC